MLSDLIQFTLCITGVSAAKGSILHKDIRLQTGEITESSVQVCVIKSEPEKADTEAAPPVAEESAASGDSAAVKDQTELNAAGLYGST